jgi:vancomycin resistance protein VanJ
VPEAPTFWQCPKCKTPNPWAGYLTNCVSCGGPRPARAAAPIFAPPPTAPPIQALAVRKGRAASILAWTYFTIVLAAWVLVKALGDRWWPATVVMFGPRWLFLLPILPLAVWTGLRRRWGAFASQVAAFLLVIGPFMGLRLPLAQLLVRRPEGEIVRILSLNRGTAGLDSKAFARLIGDGRYDIVCFQEAKADPVLDAYFQTTKWYPDKAGTIWSRYPVVSDLGSFSDRDFEVRGAWPAALSRIRVRLKNGREVIIANTHLPTMTYGFERLSRGDFDWVRYYTDWRKRQAEKVVATLRETAAEPLILAGDFNMPPDSPFMGLFREHYTSGFEEVGWGYGYTRPSRVSWIGIDRVLASRDLTFLSSRVGPRVGSDHRPIDAEIVVPKH